MERFPYQNGMLVWFANGEYGDNNTSAHPGGGEVLPVDARPAPVMLQRDGALLGNRRQPFDATFGQEATDAVTFHRQVLTGHGKGQQVETLAATVPASDGIPTFDDTVAGVGTGPRITAPARATGGGRARATITVTLRTVTW